MFCELKWCGPSDWIDRLQGLSTKDSLTTCNPLKFHYAKIISQIFCAPEIQMFYREIGSPLGDTFAARLMFNDIFNMAICNDNKWGNGERVEVLLANTCRLRWQLRAINSPFEINGNQMPRRFFTRGSATRTSRQPTNDCIINRRLIMACKCRLHILAVYILLYNLLYNVLYNFILDGIESSRTRLYKCLTSIEIAANSGSTQSISVAAAKFGCPKLIE